MKDINLLEANLIMEIYNSKVTEESVNEYYQGLSENIEDEAAKFIIFIERLGTIYFVEKAVNENINIVKNIIKQVKVSFTFTEQELLELATYVVLKSRSPVDNDYLNNYKSMAEKINDYSFLDLAVASKHDVIVFYNLYKVNSILLSRANYNMKGNKELIFELANRLNTYKDKFDAIENVPEGVKYGR